MTATGRRNLTVRELIANIRSVPSHADLMAPIRPTRLVEHDWRTPEPPKELEIAFVPVDRRRAVRILRALDQTSDAPYYVRHYGPQEAVAFVEKERSV